MSQRTQARVKRQRTEWQKIFAKQTLDKVLIPKIYKELLHQNNRKQPAELMCKIFKAHFSQDDIHMANQNIKR